ncbi:hypothetical protein VE23_22835 [Paenibacillus sp. D9]|uniref:glycosyltransferase family 4 protein n=1 Tax=Paenibacillus sp. D9 TaxID=665792 RepID=UPI00061E1994|nr:glycosyltransferase family 4 protein [Paenibacillus sp. D9]KKC49266.1 hypothetical protein VE23_22835 [Paenibacillus sp. D9]
MSKVYILHENGAPRHFEALFFYNNQSNIVQVEFTFLRQFIKSILKRDGKLLRKSLFNLFYLIRFLFMKHSTIIIGAAPYDSFIFYLYLLKNKHNIIYYSSWPYWDDSKYPKRLRFWGQKKLWIKFLTDIKVVGVTDKVKQGLLKYTKEENINVIPHCINEDTFNLKEKKSFEKFKIIYTGRLIKEKGIDTILKLIKRFEDDNIEWIFVGSGPYETIIKNESNKNSNIKFYGQVENKKELADLYRQSHIIILPSNTNDQWEELFGIVLIEGMACGAVPISSNAIGPKTIIEHNSDGFLFEPNDLSGMQSIIEKLKDDPEFYQRLSQTAVEKSKNYSIKRTSEIWGSIIGNDSHVLKLKNA